MTMRKERQMHFATRAAMAAALAGAILGSGIKLGAAEEPGKQVEPSGPPGVKLSLFGVSLFGVRPISAAHNAVGLAGESPVVGIDCLPTLSYSTLAWGDPVSESSNVNVLERRASQLAGRNMSTNLSSE